MSGVSVLTYGNQTISGVKTFNTGLNTTYISGVSGSSLNILGYSDSISAQTLRNINITAGLGTSVINAGDLVLMGGSLSGAAPNILKTGARITIGGAKTFTSTADITIKPSIDQNGTVGNIVLEAGLSPTYNGKINTFGDININGTSDIGPALSSKNINIYRRGDFFGAPSQRLAISIDNNNVDFQNGMGLRVSGIQVTPALYATSSNLATTGSTLQSSVNTLTNNLATTGSTLSTNIATTGSTLTTQINNLSGVSVLTYGNQTIDGTKTFRNSVYIHDLYVTGTEFIANVQNNFIESSYILLNLTGGAVDGGIFFVTGSGLSGVNDYGPILGFDHKDKFKFGIARRSDDLSTLNDIAAVQDITNYSGFVNNKYATITNLNLTGNNLETQINTISTKVIYTTGNQIKSGRLVIGDTILDTSNPYTLSLQSNNQDTFLEILNSGGAGKGGFVGMNGNNFELYNWQGGDIVFFTAENPSVGIERLYIKNDGKVGIGTSFPSEKLEVNGNIKASGASFTNRPTVNGNGLLLNGEAYPSNNPSGFITGIDLSSYVTTGQTGNFYTNNNPSGYITGVDLSNYYTKDNPSGFITGVDTSNFYTKDNPSGFITNQNVVYTTGDQTISGVKTFATGIDIFNGTSPQSLRIFNTTGTNSGEFGVFGWQATGTGSAPNALVIGAQASQSGALRDVIITGKTITLAPTGIVDNLIVNKIRFTNSSGPLIDLAGANTIALRNVIIGWDQNPIGIGNTDLYITRDAGGILAQRNGLNSQQFRVYNYTGTNSGEFATFGWQATGTGSAPNALVIGAQATQSGILRNVVITGNGINIQPSGGAGITVDSRGRVTIRQNGVGDFTNSFTVRNPANNFTYFSIRDDGTSTFANQGVSFDGTSINAAVRNAAIVVAQQNASNQGYFGWSRNTDPFNNSNDFTTRLYRGGDFELDLRNPAYPTSGHRFRVFNVSGTNTGEFGVFGWQVTGTVTGTGVGGSGIITGNLSALVIGSQAIQSGTLRDVILTGRNIFLTPSLSGDTYIGTPNTGTNRIFLANPRATSYYQITPNQFNMTIGQIGGTTVVIDSNFVNINNNFSINGAGYLFRESTNGFIGLRDTYSVNNTVGTNNQGFNIYKIYSGTAGVNREFLTLGWTGFTAIIGTSIGTSGTLRDLIITGANINLASSGVIISNPTVPTSTGSAGTRGQISWDNDFIYVCVSGNSWKRSALTTW